MSPAIIDYKGLLRHRSVSPTSAVGSDEAESVRPLQRLLAQHRPGHDRPLHAKGSTALRSTRAVGGMPPYGPFSTAQRARSWQAVAGQSLQG